MPDYAAMLDSIYDALGVAARLDDVVVTIIDKTEGVSLESANGGFQFGAAKPAACIRVSELDDNGMERDGLKGLTLSFNDNNWKITSTQPKPKPGTKGELYLLLQNV